MASTAAKRAAGYHAVAKYVTRNMRVGLGTGSTAKFAVDAVAEKAKDGLQFQCVCTSKATEEQAKELGLDLKTLEECPQLDVAIDGADEIDTKTLALIKGAGAALLREKLVELCADTLVIVADESKLVERLGLKMKLPVEVVCFGWHGTRNRIESTFGCIAEQRITSSGNPCITDNGNFILDCDFRKIGGISDPALVGQQLKAIPGVVEHGLFVGMAKAAHVCMADGSIRVFEV
eukprot:TRINITY_DN5790_c0_g1_i2.p1 TRINITY_DN5790_c0_g1~~TRINITY_DN5790_c0_g1_i2.p1  ORF type:complete len:234 (+),score=49.15 TRINITY_DN5790_c0_g1_i2:42-743(+)